MNIIVPHGFEANYTVGYVRGLMANGVECCVISDDDVAPRLDAAGVPHVNLRGSTRENRNSAAKLWNLLRYYVALLGFILRNRGATVHFTGILRNELILLEGGLLHPALRLISGSYVYTAHNVLPHSRSNSRFFRRAYAWVYRWPNTILAHSERVAAELTRDFGVPRSKLQIATIGLNEEVPSSALTTAEARRQLGLGATDQAILFFGKIDSYKGLDRLIDAFDRLPLPRARLIIAGAFRDEAYRVQITGQLTRATRKSDIRLLEGSVPNDQVEVLFKACDVLCMPYRRIYQSGVVLLAPRFGLPVVATPVGSLPDFVIPEFGILSQTEDAAGVRSALLDFFTRRQRFNREEIIARAQAMRWERVCGGLVPLYASRPEAPITSKPSIPSRVP